MPQNDGPERDLRNARLAVFGLFGVFGTVLATWAVHLPSVKQSTGMSASMLGTTLLILGAGALVGMQVSGALVDRFGSGPIAIIGLSAMAIAVLGPLTAHTVLAAAVGAFVFGLTSGTADVSMNAAAVAVERKYGKPIMASFHAMFSVGSVVGSLIGAIGYALGVAVIHVALAVTIGGLSFVGAASSSLRRPYELSADVSTQSLSANGEPEKPSVRAIIVLGTIGFLLLLAEGSAMDWSALHAQQHLQASTTISAITLSCFVVAMTAGRFAADSFVARYGPVNVLRWGSGAAAVGLALVVVSPFLPLTLLGWSVMGLGLAGGIPQVFTAAGNLGAGSGRILSRVVGTAYLALLAGPAVIGWLADRFSIDGAFVLPLVGILICICLAGAVGSGGQSDRARS